MIRQPRSHSGSALVVTLLVIAVLAIIVVAFLQSMTLERQTARSYLDRYKAELAADAAQREATNRLATLMKDNPYHGIGYMPGPATGTLVDGENPVIPVLYGAPTATAAPSPTPHYLVSGTDTQLGKNATLDPSDSTVSIALNRKNGDSTNDFSGWMGSPSPIDPATGEATGPPTAATYRECRAPWVYVVQDPTKPHQPNPQSANYNPYISRYAWWIEDESSKIDLLKAGNNKKPGGGFLPPPLENLADTDDTANPAYKDQIAWRPADLDLGAIPVHAGQPIATADTSSNDALIDFLQRLSNPPKDTRLLNQVPGYNGSESTARFYTTLSSVSNELSGNGRRRINLNSLVHNDASNPTRPLTAQAIASDIDDIAYAIAGKHIITNRGDTGLFASEPDETPGTSGSALLQNFGDRFWPSSDNQLKDGSLASKKQEIYLTKIAVNIRDYIDTDSYPTFVDVTGNVISRDNLPELKNPNQPFPNDVFPNVINLDPMPRAIGKESIPYLIKFGFSVANNSGSLNVYETFSFFNPSTKTFIAPSGTLLQCFDRTEWTSSSSPPPGFFQMPPYILDLSDIQFPAGKVVVLTTSPGALTDPTNIPTAFRPAALKMSPANAATHTETPTTTYKGHQRTGSNYDSSTKMVWSGPDGYFGGFAAVTVTSFTPSGYNMTVGASNKRVNNMEGNNSSANTVPTPPYPFPSHTGEAQSLNEPLTFNGTTGAKGNGDFQDQTRFYDDTSLPLVSAFSQYISPQIWPDYTKNFSALGGGSDSYAVIRDQPMTSIGELGNIYDPYRRRGSGSIDFARGGGRTLRIGQPDDVTVDGSGEPNNQKTAANTDPTANPRFGARWLNSAWRLTDVFDVILDPASTPNAGKPDLTTHLVPPQADGKLNINSVRRDGGVALRSLLRNFTYLSDTAPSGVGGAPYGVADLNHVSLNDNDILKIVTAIRNYIKKNGPIIERGELSQVIDQSGMPIFSGSSDLSKPLKDILDRGREEIFRRLIEMITTRSASYTVYSMGQSLREQADSSGAYQPVVIGTSTKAVTYRLDPVISGNTGAAITDTNPKDIPTAYQAIPLYVHP